VPRRRVRCRPPSETSGWTNWTVPSRERHIDITSLPSDGVLASPVIVHALPNHVHQARGTCRAQNTSGHTGNAGPRSAGPRVPAGQARRVEGDHLPATLHTRQLLRAQPRRRARPDHLRRPDRGRHRSVRPIFREVGDRRREDVAMRNVEQGRAAHTRDCRLDVTNGCWSCVFPPTARGRLHPVPSPDSNDRWASPPGGPETASPPPDAATGGIRWGQLTHFRLFEHKRGWQALEAKLGANRRSLQATPGHSQLTSVQLDSSLSDTRRHTAMLRRCLLNSGSRARTLP
jgi:hypothetical protein